MSVTHTLNMLARDLEAGSTSAVALAEAALSRITWQREQGIPAFVRINAAVVLREARQSDERRRAGRSLSPYDGVPFAVKDLLDIAGEATPAGSKLLSNAPAAETDSDAVATLRAKGLVVLGRTNMTEFAYSGLGLNPHHGTPPSIYDRKTGRIPGGSSSGSAVAVADGVCAIALGTDTGGSCRIPAAFNGIAGFKPTASRISKRGAFPLSSLFDSVGPLAATAQCCAIADDLLTGGDGTAMAVAPSRPMRLGALSNYVMDGLEPAVAADYARGVARLKACGAVVEDFSFPDLAELPALLQNGGIVASEAWHLHKIWLADSEEKYDPRVASRIRLGSQTSSMTFARLLARRAEMVASFASAASAFDAVMCPAVPMVAPRLADLGTDEEYRRLNGLVLRNTYVFNFLDCCAGVVPMHAEGAAPTGLMLAGPAGTDRLILATMAKVQAGIS
jgi:aspartyl-tRNA(Asn)/glutamyl-tRNA(Gln) amidotransferase subunit A